MLCFENYANRIGSNPIFAPAMRKIALSFIAVAALGCHNKEEVRKKQFPKPGAVIASAEMPVTDDELNHFVFSVKVIADSNIASGVYDVDADYGPNYAMGQFTMPKGGEDLVPIIRRGASPYTFVIGFKQPNDTTFYEYFEVKSSRKTTKMQYLKAYTF